jgi:hypothetical protein
MLTEPKYCEMCTQQFFRVADAPIQFRAKYCPACERAIAHAAHEQATNATLIGRQYFQYKN